MSIPVQKTNFKHLEQDEPILTPNPRRFLLNGIEYPELWALFKKHESSFWVMEEIDLQYDKADWDNKLNDNERHFLKNVLGFFAGSDGIVNENLCVNFMKIVQIPEARAFYTFQSAMETIHAETYSALIVEFVPDPLEQDVVFDMYLKNPAVAAKATWAMTYIEDPNLSFHERLVAFAAVEGIFFSSSFCSIFWLKKRGILPGLAFSNEVISRDESLHTDFACLLYSLLKQKLPRERVHQIIDSAVETEKLFVKSALPVKMIGMNSDSMLQYVKFCADRLLLQLGYDKKYNVQNPFDFMGLISLSNKTNFFERKVAEYSMANVRVSGNVDNNEPSDAGFAIDNDF